MTLEEYYIAWEQVNAPEGIGFLEKREFYRTERKKLQDQLSKKDLEIVLSRQREWQRKMQSSVGS